MTSAVDSAVVLRDVVGVQDKQLPALAVSGLQLDSRKVVKGDAFIAVPGHATDGRLFIDDAINAGASWLLVEARGLHEVLPDWSSREFSGVPITLVDGLVNQVSRLAANFYGHPSHKLTMIGITGTNGKTSCSHLVAGALTHLQQPALVLGTMGTGLYGSLSASENTTADPVSMQRILAEGVSQGIAYAALEVSSHGLDQGRVADCAFDVAVFTNLTRDHLDYHGDMESYAQTKRRLLLWPALQVAVINADDRYGRKLLKDPSITAHKFAYTIGQPSAGADLDNWIWADQVRYTLSGIQAKVYTPWGKGEISSPLMGHFNLSNLLAVIAALGSQLDEHSQLNDFAELIKAINQVEPIAGRMQRLGGDDLPLVLVDYAHTPDALEQSLNAVREHNVGNIWCVFGCGGDRDPGKRPLMAAVAEKLANRVILTNDNPRNEPAERIVEDVRSGLRNPDEVPYYPERNKAIRAAVEAAKPGDAVLIAGKGHEDYQLIMGEKRHHSDVESARQALVQRSEGGKSS